MLIWQVDTPWCVVFLWPASVAANCVPRGVDLLYYHSYGSHEPQLALFERMCLAVVCRSLIDSIHIKQFSSSVVARRIPCPRPLEQSWLSFYSSTTRAMVVCTTKNRWQSSRFTYPSAMRVVTCTHSSRIIRCAILFMVVVLKFTY